MERKKPRWKSKSGLKKESGRWRPTTRQVFWAIGMVVTLTTIALLVVQLYPGLWADVSREPVATLLGIGVALMVLIVLLAMGSASLGWTGFRGKTLWDVLQLLIVPFALAVIGILFTIQQNARQEQIENQRAKVDREIEDTRAEQALLQSYLDQMGALLLDRNLRAADEDSNVRNVARARTLTTLAALNDPRRKQKALRFLDETRLIQASPPNGEPVISLSYAELHDVKLGHSGRLGGFDLQGIVLVDADLRNVRMLNANVRDADLREADLSGADLTNAKLGGANLLGANLTKTDLTDTRVTNEQLEAAKSLKGATMPDGSEHP